jgi:pimeloyl-ACP methyl ester carboxylesterase
MYVEIGGIPQWIELESDHADNPALLLLHGGPGVGTRGASASWRPWRRHFTLVHWDQRGAGRTFTKNGPHGSGPMTFEQFVSDGLEVAAFVREQLGGRKIFLLGHSWGSAIGVHMVRRRPELFAAFVGTGQLVNWRGNETANYERELEMAGRTGNQAALAELTGIGPPPHAELSALGVLRKWGDELSDGMGDAPQPRPPVRPDNMTPEDIQAIGAGFAFSTAALYRDLCAVDLPAIGTDFSIPMFVFMGTHDSYTPMSLAETYLQSIAAPRKAFVRFEGCHHFVHMNRPADFLQALVTHLGPFAHDP